jgi:Glycosyltransferase family 87
VITARLQVAAAGVGAAIVASAMVAMSSSVGADYAAPPCDPDICDDAAIPIDALVRGDFHAFFSEQQPMGPFSLLLRAPLAGLSWLLGDGGQLARYRLGSFACLLAAALLALWLARTMARRGMPWTAWAIVPIGVLVNPLTYQALNWGHPEEVLAAALCTAGVLAAAHNRGVPAGLLLGCALATKPWAVLAVPVALVAAPSGAVRMRLAAAAVPVAGALLAPMFLLDPDRFLAVQHGVGTGADLTNKVTAANVWFPFADASTARGIDPHGLFTTTTQYSLPTWVAAVSRLAVVAVAVAVPLAFARRGRGGEDALAVLALVLLVRCLLDPMSFSYHHVPFLVALVAWEALRRRVPVASIATFAAVIVTQELVAPARDATLVNVFYLTWTVPLASYLAWVTVGPRRIAGREAPAYVS